MNNPLFNDEAVKAMTLPEFQAHCKEHEKFYGMNDVDVSGYWNSLQPAKPAKDDSKGKKGTATEPNP